MTHYIVVAAMVLAAFGAWKVQDWRAGYHERERLAAEAERRRFDAKTVNAAATGHEVDKRGLRREFVVITKEVERVVEKPFYRDACLDDDGLRQLAAAVGARAAASEPARAVPRPGGTD